MQRTQVAVVAMTRKGPKSASTGRKSRSAAAAGDTGPERLLKIGEAASLIGVETYVLRFWETQFPILRPRHTRSRHRYYGPEDIQTLKLIKRLLHTEGFTIAGAKKHIREVGLDKLRESVADEHKPAPIPAAARNEAATALDTATQHELLQIRDDLRSLRRMLEG